MKEGEQETVLHVPQSTKCLVFTVIVDEAFPRGCDTSFGNRHVTLFHFSHLPCVEDPISEGGFSPVHCAACRELELDGLDSPGWRGQNS